MATNTFNPVTTYRIQLHRDFRFSQLSDIISYLHQLGVHTVYASPVFTSVPGSTHGYDGTSPLEINPEIGRMEELEEINQKLRSLGIGWLQDIVPNHMAFHSNNHWLWDVLEHGAESEYASYFDTALADELFREKLMVPFLGSALEAAIENDEIMLSFKDGRFGLQYYDEHYPLRPESYTHILSDGPAQELQAYFSTEQDKKTEAWKAFRSRLNTSVEEEPSGKTITDKLEKINGDKELLLQIAGEQHYRLCHWQETDSRISYRRFFTINGLICLNMQEDKVFDHCHALVKKMADADIFSGLRVDHIDGLYAPQIYLERLRALAGETAYIVVEKILQYDESLPASWPVQGNTGYDFLAVVSNLFTLHRSQQVFTDFYNVLTGEKHNASQLLPAKKRSVLEEHMRGELDNLCHLFISATDDLPAKRNITFGQLKKVIEGMLVHCPVYRYYSGSFPLNETESAAVEKLIAHVCKEDRSLKDAAALIREVLLSGGEDGSATVRISGWYSRLMQFTGPLMAKGMEDTLMYTYNRFIAHNDVGDHPGMFGITADAFHEWMKNRRQQWSASLNATSTHDTKRGEDVRARLNVLTEISSKWTEKVLEWMEMNRGFKTAGMPDNNDEYFLYQTIAGAFPMLTKDAESFSERLQDYIPKVLREAKTHSQWAEPNEVYEQATLKFAQDILAQGSSFRTSLEQWLPEIIDGGIINSLAQLLLKCTCPGTPDIYQGTELWDLSLVDPDNRRPVDYALRNSLLEAVSGVNDISGLWEKRTDGSIKLWLTQRLLAERKAHPEMFGKGSYIPVEVKGKYKKHVLAFARQFERAWYVVAVPLHYTLLCEETGSKFHDVNWEDTSIILPDYAPGEWQHLLWPASGNADKEILLSEAFGKFPLALMRLETAAERSAGILMHITSLPSSFGMGDMGPAAKTFADFLYESGQKYWQLLPLNPVSDESDYSPYSSISAMAGNELIISPELLAAEGLIDAALLKEHALSFTDHIDFSTALSKKKLLLDEAWKNYSNGHFPLMQQQFDIFCTQEQDWLNDFALFVSIKKTQNNAPWFQWSDEYKHRDSDAMKAFAAENEQEMQYTRWQQFLFARQWKQLKAYCNGLGIRLFGDLPFYVSHDSSDVWAHPDIFCLDQHGEMCGIAGVPPDYFSADGQLWGMPTYNWNELKQQEYGWWMRRLRKNMELYDLLRLDHFRAFAQYWQVQAGESTARNGQWVDGPGTEFFTSAREKLGHLPFVAEDLGDHMEAVYRLRDEIKLPGMKVLQFAFGSHMPQSVDIPHNYVTDCIVYTGTHDNNTTAGWYEDETGRADHKRLEKYAGTRIHGKNIHDVLMRMAYASVASTVIIPVQDILGLGRKSRMNTPGTGSGNWRWRLSPDALTGKLQKKLCNWAKMYNRL